MENGAAHGSISLIVPVYSSATTLRLLWSRIEKIMEDTGQPFEVVFVDDGSVDTSVAVLRNIARQDGRVRVLVHARNLGQAAAVLTGIDRARGAVLVTLDDDLQHRPEDIPRLLRRLAMADERTLVVAVPAAARGPWWRSVARTVANRISNLLMRKPIPMRLSTFCAFHKSLGEMLTCMGLHQIAWVATLVQAAERTITISVKIDASAQPRSRYGVRSLWTLFRCRTRLFLLSRILSVFVSTTLVAVAAFWTSIRLDGGAGSTGLMVLAATTAIIAVMAVVLACLMLAERHGARRGEGAPLLVSFVGEERNEIEGWRGH